MGKRGPRPTPSNILKLRGSWRGAANQNEPQPRVGEPDYPEGLAEQAKSVWDQLVPLLSGMGVLTKIDGIALGRYCQYWVRWKECEAHVAKYGMTYPIKDKEGKIQGMVEFPQVRRSQALSLTLSRLEAEFGMTPSARSRITVPESTDKPTTKDRFFA